MSNETEKIKERYDKRKNSETAIKNSKNFYFNHYAQSERELRYLQVITDKFDDFSEKKVLELGAGTGTNLYFFQKLGFKNENIYANELLVDRFEFLKNKFPQLNLLKGDAGAIDENLHNTFHIVFQSTVFTSILDDGFKKKIADKMWSLLKPGGIILWYDFKYDNPNNKDVKGVKKQEIKDLFPNHNKIKFHSVTLAPPIGRRVKKCYHFFNFFPFLRTHLIAVIEKEE